MPFYSNSKSEKPVKAKEYAMPYGITSRKFPFTVTVKSFEAEEGQQGLA